MIRTEHRPVSDVSKSRYAHAAIPSRRADPAYPHPMHRQVPPLLALAAAHRRASPGSTHSAVGPLYPLPTGEGAGLPRRRGTFADFHLKRGTIAAALLAAGIALATGSPVLADWETFTSAEDGFSAEFPMPPTYTDIVEMQGDTIALFHDYRAFTDTSVFLVDVVRFTPATRAARTDAELLATAVEGVAGSDCEASAPFEIPGDGGVAHEVTFTCPNDLTMRARFRIAGAWLYQAGAGGGPGVAGGPDAVRFLDSFRLTADGPAE